MNSRMEKTLKLLGGVDGLLVTNPIDLFYLTGCRLSAGLLLLGSETRLFVDGRYFDYCKEKSGIAVSLPDDLRSFIGSVKIGFEKDLTSFSLYEEWKDFDLVPLNPVVRLVRQIKEPEEVEALGRAAALANQGYRHLLPLLREGVTEAELSGRLQSFWFANGGEGASFEPIIAFGENSAFPHHRPSKRRLKRGDLVLFDMGVQFEDYQSDMTRIRFFGDADPEIEKIANIVKGAQEKAFAICRAGITAEELDGVARDHIESFGYELVHSLGHGVGLEVHEPPRLKKGGGLLEENMIITIEPGIYIPGLGGVRLEETVRVTADGYELITIRDEV